MNPRNQPCKDSQQLTLKPFSEQGVLSSSRRVPFLFHHQSIIINQISILNLNMNTKLLKSLKLSINKTVLFVCKRESKPDDLLYS